MDIAFFILCFLTLYANLFLIHRNIDFKVEKKGVGLLFKLMRG